MRGAAFRPLCSVHERTCTVYRRQRHRKHRCAEVQADAKHIGEASASCVPTTLSSTTCDGGRPIRRIVIGARAGNAGGV
jgi:hypothetical protein